jgi:hypothetical protein
MTSTPTDLDVCRAYIRAQTGLPPASVGIQHYQPDGGGYHEGRDLLAGGSPV